MRREPDGGGETVSATDLLAEAAARKDRVMWGHSAYRECSPGEQAVEAFLAAFNLLDTPPRERPGVHILDLGCGTGRPARAVQDRGFSVTGVD